MLLASICRGLHVQLDRVLLLLLVPKYEPDESPSSKDMWEPEVLYVGGPVGRHCIG